MRYYDDMCQILRRIAFSLKLMEGLREDTMQEEWLHIIFYTQFYGGQHCIRIQKHIVRHAMHVNEPAGHRRGTICH